MGIKYPASAGVTSADRISYESDGNNNILKNENNVQAALDDIDAASTNYGDFEDLINSEEFLNKSKDEQDEILASRYPNLDIVKQLNNNFADFYKGKLHVVGDPSTVSEYTIEILNFNDQPTGFVRHRTLNDAHYDELDITSIGKYKFNYKSNGVNKSKVVEVSSFELKTVVLEPFEFKSFQEATLSEINDMLNAYYNDEIDLFSTRPDGKQWKVNDKHLISLNDMIHPGNNSSVWAAQNIWIVITTTERHKLTTPIQGKNKLHTRAAITCQTINCLNPLSNSNGYTQNDTDGFIGWNLHVTSSSYVVGTNNETINRWRNLALRRWMNSMDAYSTPDKKSLYMYGLNTTDGSGVYFRDIIKSVKRTLIDGVYTPQSDGNYSGANLKVMDEFNDYVFLPTHPEIFGATTFPNYVNNQSPIFGTEDGKNYGEFTLKENGKTIDMTNGNETVDTVGQWEYYQQDRITFSDIGLNGVSPRIKYGNVADTGVKGSYAVYWWSGSRSSYSHSTYGWLWCDVSPSGAASNDRGRIACGLAPAFAM